MLNLPFATLIARAIVLLIAFTIHELAHALTADRMGDPTPRRMGRVTLNPLAHLDPFGTIMLLFSGFGWAKPVMVQPMYFRGNPRTGMAIVAAAGPISNVVMAALGAFLVRLGLVAITPIPTLGAIPDPGYVLFEFIWINLILAFFNLIPIPPLDGFKILSGVLPPEMAQSLYPLERYGFMILLGLIFFLPLVGIDVIGRLIGTPASYVFGLLIGW